MNEYDTIGSIIMQLGGGDARRIENLRWRRTHEQVIEAFLSSQLSD